ncbi:MAG: hypothetical protein IV085_06310 [Thiobacillus sp.]|nr:hypothetical protein [Thiobacillus sp.]
MIRRWIVLACLALGSAHAADMTELRYRDQDPGTAAYLTRILVTSDFMRMDGGEDGGDFFLLDRRQRKLINVMRDNKMALVFKPGKVPAKPKTWQPRLETRGATPGTTGFTLSVKNVVCNEGIAARKAAPDAARAMSEMKSVLAGMQYRVWNETLPAMQHDCDLANHVWETGTTLKLGLPLQEREFTGRTRVFESERKLPLDPKLFRVPAALPLVDAPS